MQPELRFLGATRQVTGSLYRLRAGDSTVLVECGLVQGSRRDEARNAEDFPFAIGDIDAVVLSHAHIDHSGRVPLLVKRGYQGPVFAHRATRDLCGIMLPDSGYLNEKDAEWENRRRHGDEARVEPLYTRADAEASLAQFQGADYGERVEAAPGISVRFHDAGHILGSAILELTAGDRTVVFSGDLGYRDAPVMNRPARLGAADAVLMESTYGDRLHRPFEDTMEELGAVFETARAAQGNILIPAFTVGRTQDLLYLLQQNGARWNIGDWHVFLDSPMGIEATGVYSRYRRLYGVDLFDGKTGRPKLANLYETRSTEESMTINGIRSGAIIIAGSGMCSGGRILHHLKHNVWRPECHIVIVGFQANGTLGRRLVDGAGEVKLWGENYAVRARVHTVGGLSAHADQADLVDWYASFENRPPLYLVHGEEKSQRPLKDRIAAELGAAVSIAEYGQTIAI